MQSPDKNDWRWIIILLGLLLIASVCLSQGCDNASYIGSNGTWTNCWDAGEPFTDECIDFTNCFPQCGGYYIGFEVVGTGVVTFIIESEINYDWNPGYTETWLHLYILDSCEDIVYTTIQCPVGTYVGIEYLVNTSTDLPWLADSDYVFTLQLPLGSYYIVAGNVGSLGAQDNLEGCAEITVINESPLGLSVEEKELNTITHLKQWTILGQRKL